MATNNIPFDFGNLEIQFAGYSLAIDAYTAFSYGWTREVGEMWGKNNKLIDLTDGVTKFDEITFTVYRSAYQNILELIGFDSFLHAGQAGVKFDLVVIDKHEASGTQLKVTFVNCTPIGAKVSYSQGSDPVTVDMTLRCTDMTG